MSYRLRLPVLTLCVLALNMLSTPAQAQVGQRVAPGTAPAADSDVADYRSRNFVVRTDLPKDEAEELLVRLEKMLVLISKYWGQPNRKTIYCYVVDDVSKWPAGGIPLEGLASVRSGGGITISQSQWRAGRLLNADARVYASTREGTPLHEAVHAYCSQTFGRTGPLWYSEGMAEMGAYWDDSDQSVQLPQHVLRYLQSNEVKSFNEIVNSDETTGDSWQNYTWRWALCHLLANNPNYSKRFRPLGMNLLLDRPDSFEQAYGNSAKEIEFEYRFFLDVIDNGLRADLIAWNWRVKSVPLRRGRRLVARVNADGGWQPSRLAVQEGQSYQVQTTGQWKTAKEAAELTGDGDADGSGRLMGVLFDPDSYALSDPFELGADLTWTADESGHLYLRCSDDWGSLGDNDGSLKVSISGIRD
ncbi:hypothetical protein [Stratiformator vulcanicus]|uniref:Plant Basic Secretory Protein n=1 Tax=Stratiformator vulcanicus TaxID=2527980 RepID=A0A517R3T8_9PLAN|nr:hypothetical protein [Stratiformator vulcanicus]QDT38503.1 hypothetical protein Pan189_28970 [Stratiformator vulcanicus]